MERAENGVTGCCFTGMILKNAVPIELKSGKAKESDVRRKLENSLKFATTLAPDPKGSGKTV